MVLEDLLPLDGLSPVPVNFLCSSLAPGNLSEDDMDGLVEATYIMTKLGRARIYST